MTRLAYTGEPVTTAGITYAGDPLAPTFRQRYRCWRTVWWDDVQMKSRCAWESGHLGDHFDGTRWFDDNGLTPEALR